MHVLVIGGSGFIGRHLIARLVADGHFVSVPTRRYAHARGLLPLPTVTLHPVDVHREDELAPLVERADVVVNLLGVLHSRAATPWGPEFDRAHVQFPEMLARLCCQYQVSHFLHISALGVSSDAPSGYLRSKMEGESRIKNIFAASQSHNWTLFRPSVVFGPDDRFMNLFAQLARWLPVLFMAGAQSRLQPVFVGDVAKVLTAVMGQGQHFGHTYDLAGPEVYTLAELVSRAARWGGHPRPVIGLPDSVGRLQACFFEKLPGEPLMSRDNLASLKVDNVSATPLPPSLGMIPTPLEAVVPRYLAWWR
ncbi:MAG TPA: NAD-dependent dehydratase [Pusillimonas sp.]|jgi:NADH dehydrogenase|nr:NAD-dependent dehydratase [Pusillimonas sp.]|tara:strand:+ start:69413 stop:70333 length:921 start_codon:yes stop_codon:yes gene_type:complete